MTLHGSKAGKRDPNACGAVLRGAAFALAFAGLSTAGYWAYQAWQPDHLQIWQLVAAVLLAVLSALPMGWIVLLGLQPSRRSAAALRESEENFRRLAEGSMEGIVIHRDQRPLYLNPAFARMFGYTTAELFALSDMQALFAEQARPQVREIGDACLRREAASSVCTIEMRHRDGQPLEVQMRTTATQWNGEGAVQATLIDITEQREAEWVLHSLHDFAAQQDLDFDARIRALLGAGCVYFDLPIGILAEIRDRRLEISNAVTPDDSLRRGDRFDLEDTFCGITVRNRRATVYRDVLDAGLCDHPCHRKLGVRAYVGIPLHVRGTVYGTLVFASLAPRERAFQPSEVRILELMGRWVAGEIARRVDERDRIESEERFRDFASTAADWFWETDSELRITYLSDNHARIIGHENDEFLGRSRIEAYGGTIARDMPGWQQHVLDVGARRPYAMHMELARADGKPLIIFDQGKPLFDDNGGFLGYRGIGRDITDRVLTERELQKHQHRLEELVAERTHELEAAQKELLQQERLATIGRLVATVSHELRNPLGAVRNAAYYLKRKTPEGWQPQLDIIEKEINAADKIISDLLETTRAKVPVIRTFDLEGLVSTVFESCRGDRRIEFRYASQPPALRLAADQDHLRQVLLNLVSNSVHALADGGTVAVDARQDASGNTIRVRDNGPGVPEEHHEHIFEPLFTTKSKGNGLGLWISKGIVERHGGSLAVESDSESGTTFTITLPHDPHAELLAAAG